MAALSRGAYNRAALQGWRRRALGAWLLASCLLLSTAALAWAEPDVSLSGADDGTLLLVGNGWRPGQQLVVSVGRDLFPVQADSAGGFEVRTPLQFSSSSGAAVAVRPYPSANAGSPAFRLLAPPDAAAGAPPAPHPLAVLFAQGIADGATWLATCLLALGAAISSGRAVRARLRPQR